VRPLTIRDVFSPLFTDFLIGRKEIIDSGMPYFLPFHLISFGYYLVTGLNPVGGVVLRRWKSYSFFNNSKGGGLFRSKPTIFQLSTKAGPNANLAILGIGIDLLG
jgi:hypothetical protein